LKWRLLMRRFLLRVWRWLRAEIVFGFLIATAFWACVLGWQAANAPTDAEKQKCYESAEKSGHRTEECKTLWERTTSDPVAFFTFWLVVSTIGLGISTILLWRAGEKQFRHARRSSVTQSRDMQASIAAAKSSVDLARQEFVATHRPRVILRYIQGPFYNDEGHRFIWLTFVNTGANSAIIQAFGGDLAQRGSSIEDWAPPGLDASPQDIVPIVLACGQRHVFTVTAKTNAISDKAIFEDAIGPGDQICAVGTIRYSDTNGVSRDTGFFRVLDDEGIGFVVSKHDSEMEYQD
jgi:hypothetical protein